MTLTFLGDGLCVAYVVDAMMMTHAHHAHINEIDSPDPERVLINKAVNNSFLAVRKDMKGAEKHSLGPAILASIHLSPTAEADCSE